MPKIPPDFQPLFYQPPCAIFKDEREYRYFRIFCDKTAYQLSGYFDSTLWSRLVLQTCQNDPSIRHAVVAIAALGQILESAKDSHERDKKGDTDFHHRFALLQYSKAIRRMRDAASEGKQDLRTTLITCLVIVCFETFHGNHESALAQVRTGLELIEDWFTKNTTSTDDRLGITSPLPSVIEDELIHAFGRLDIQSMSFLDTRTLTTHQHMKNYGTASIQSMPAVFTTVKEARIYLELVMQRLLHFMATTLIDITDRGCIQVDAIVNCSFSVIAERDKYLAELESWHAAFQPLYAINTQSPSQEHFLGVTALQMHYLATYFGIACKITTEPHLNRLAFMSNFEQQFKCAREILEHPKMAAEDCPYTFDLQVIVPLYVVVWQCPYNPLRREATALLLSRPRREGFWDAFLAGKLGEWIIEVETEEDPGVEWMEDDMRIAGLDMKFDMHARTASLKCEKPVRRKDGGGLEFVRRSKVVTW